MPTKTGAKSDPRSVKALDKFIGARIRAVRLDAGLSQETLAGAIGVTFQQIQKYEKGVNRVATTTLIAIAQALDSDITSFIPTTAGRDPDAPNDPGLDQIAFHYVHLNNDGRRLLLATAKQYARDPTLSKRS